MFSKCSCAACFCRLFLEFWISRGKIGGELSLLSFSHCRWSHSKHFRPKPLRAPSSAREDIYFHLLLSDCQAFGALLDAWNFLSLMRYRRGNYAGENQKCEDCYKASRDLYFYSRGRIIFLYSFIHQII